MKMFTNALFGEINTNNKADESGGFYENIDTKESKETNEIGSEEIGSDRLETCESELSEGINIERAYEVAEGVHYRTINQILELYGEYIPPEGLDRIRSGIDSINMCEHRVGDVNIGSFSYHEGRSEINIHMIDDSQIESTMQHETNHFVSYNDEMIGRATEGSDNIHVSKKSGIHLLEYTEGPNEEIIECRDLNRGFNEGITQMYTNRQLELIEPGKGREAARQNGYMFATELAEQVEDIVGSDIVARAYYGGRLELLMAEIDRRGGLGSFDKLSEAMNKVTYENDYYTRIFAMRDAQDILAAMSEGDKA